MNNVLSMIYNVKFPGLNFGLQINPIAFKIGSIRIYWYGIIVCIAFLLALWYVLANCKRFRINVNDMVDVIIIGLICGIIGARLYYVIFYPGDLYIKNPIKILYINQGGIAIYGGIIGGLLGGSFIAKRKDINLLSALDITSLGFLIGQGIGRWGNFVNQEAFGTQTDIFCRMVSENTGGVTVHPCFLYESLWCILGFILLHVFSVKYKRYDGQLFFLYLVWYGVERFFVESLRTDSLLIPGIGIKVSQVVAVITVLVGIFMLFKLRSKKSLPVNDQND